MTYHLEQANSLSSDALVELFELDLTALTSVYSRVGQGTIYRWTPGVMDFELRGAVVAATVNNITLDRQVRRPNAALTYSLTITYANGTVADPIVIGGFGLVAGSSPVQSVLGLVSDLPLAPSPGDTWTLSTSGSVYFNGNEYEPKPIEGIGWEWNGTGKLPRPILHMSNVDGMASALVLAFGNLEGAKVTRLRTYKSCLDGEANADPTAFFEPDIHYVDRKSAQNKSFVEFELAAALDFQGVRLPRRVCLRETCDNTYRQWIPAGGWGSFAYGSCPYNGGSYFKADGTPTGNPAEDVCGLRFSDCKLRYGGAPLPFGGFPGIALVNM